MLARLDRPETWLALHGFLIAFLWEMLQMPFFAMSDMSGWQQTKACALASLGDAGIMVGAYLVGRWVSGSPRWLHGAPGKGLVAYLLTGLAITIAVEDFAVRAPWGWEYSALMPQVAGIGLVPILMWIIVPLLALRLARRSTLSVQGG